MTKIEIKKLTFGYDQQGENLFEQVELNLNAHWKLGFIGRNGCGKTTFLQLLQKKLPYEGSIQHRIKFSVLSSIYSKSQRSDLFCFKGNRSGGTMAA